jgi:hypothetical protein
MGNGVFCAVRADMLLAGQVVRGVLVGDLVCLRTRGAQSRSAVAVNSW